MVLSRRTRRTRLGRFEQLEARCALAADLAAAVAVAPASLAGRVWVDATANRRLDTGDLVVANAHLHLLDSQGAVVATTRTNGQGEFHFAGLAAGIYSVREIQPTGIAQGGQFAGSLGGDASQSDLITGVTLEAGEIATGYDFWETAGDTVGSLDSDGAPPLISQGEIVPEPTTPPPQAPSAGSVGPSPTSSPPQTTTATFLQSFAAAPPAQLVAPPAPVIPQFAPALPQSNGVDLPAPRQEEPIDGIRGSAPRWRLKVLNQPAPVEDEGEAAQVARQTARNLARRDLSLTGGKWLWPVLEGERVIAREVVFGHPYAVPVVGDFDGDGRSELSLYLNGAWYLRSLTREEPADIALAQFGERGAQPVVGDWDADGWSDIGLYAGTANVPVAGDWDGDGAATIGVFERGIWRLAANRPGSSSEIEQFTFGQAGDQPVVGDFNGDGRDEVGIFRDGVWILDANGNHHVDPQDRTFRFGQTGDRAVVGDFDGDGRDEPGVYRSGASPPVAEGEATNDLPLLSWLSGGE